MTTTAESVVATRARSGRPLRVGIIGLGARDDLWACLAHLPALRALPGFEVTALSTSSPESAARAGEIHGVARTFGKATDLAACDEVDLVVVSVRVPAHRELVSAAIQAGKAVFCEWPLGNGLAETEELARLVGDHDVPSIVGLQIRANPVMNYLRDLVADGYVGEVLSTTVIGSAGGTWGAYSDPNSRYLLDPANGATLLTVPFSHALDGLAWVLGEPQRLRIEHAVRRHKVTEAQTGQRLVMTSPDQVVASGRLTDGAVASLHFRGGHFPGTNFHWEINGTEGDIVVTAPIGHIQLAPLTLLGARGDAAALAVLPVPESYRKVASLDWPATDGAFGVADFYRQGAFGVAHLYQQFLEDLREGGNSVPDFSDAVVRHRSIDNASSMP
jgi:predicted dehydrogenase